MRRLLIPFDGSDSSLHALQYAIDLARDKFVHELEVLHVGNPMPIGTHGMMTHEEIAHREANEAGRILQPARALLEAAGISYQVRSRTGTPANEIAKQVKEGDCDGIVMGTRGLGSIASMMMGSVASRIVATVDVPVTLVK
ncbi:universal stress protein [Noviherbaspirillum sp. CPCC 100848]|uniref:Universal stress protein n=1 Tax=Noviherbaspirillum album TaxID=3080276 RepID=A0ABU6JHI4_9BURK|nr:universal stress protein [Noviherbaspirillum sp. CPCC 100848]MEC4723125.1 universal stress protein [Noviherbaspirillum sp. CPCC 100848]